MLPTIEEQNNKIQQLFNNLDNIVLREEPILVIISKQYAKWYAEKVIEECAEIAETNCTQTTFVQWQHKIDKQSILKLKKQL